MCIPRQVPATNCEACDAKTNAGKITSLKLLTDKSLDHQIHCLVIKAKREPDHPIETTHRIQTKPSAAAAKKN